MSQDQPFIYMGKQLGRAPKLGGVESLGISKVYQIVSASMIESQIWHHLASSVGEGQKRDNGFCLP